MPTRGAEPRANCRLISTVRTATTIIYPRLSHAEPIAKTGLANFAAKTDAVCLRIARSVIWKKDGVWAAVAVAGL